MSANVPSHGSRPAHLTPRHSAAWAPQGQGLRTGAAITSRPAYFAAELLLLAGALALIAFVAAGHLGPLAGDVGLTVWWQHLVLPHRLLTSFIEEDSTLNWPQPSAITITAIAAAFAALRRWLDLLVALGVLAVADGTNYLINQAIRRPRPIGHGVVVDRQITNVYSFPSGHVEHAVAFLGVVLFLSFIVRRPLPIWVVVPLWAVRIALFAAIAFMLPSRVLEGEHWPSDGLAGLLYGGFWLLVAIQVYWWAARRWPRLLGVGEPRAEPAAG